MMAVNAQQVYTDTVRAPPPAERLRLAAIILNELIHRPDTDIVGYSDTWSEQDQEDLMAFSLQYVASAYPEDEAPT